MEVPSVTLIRKLKLYGIQFYNDQVIIYSLSKPCEYSYLFIKDFEFPALGESSILTQCMPTFFENFFAISQLIKETHTILVGEMFSVVDTQEIFEETNELPSPHVPPPQKTKGKS